ncbi:MAG: hypothetical protein N2645_15555 [Clostridia bacterium]|nr:hypothetical protein [Clostridia bacterium]
MKTMRYFVMEEDIHSEYKVYLDDLNLGLEEKKAMLLGDRTFIPLKHMLVPVKHRLQEEMSDYLSTKLTFVSHGLKDLIEENTITKIYYRYSFLLYKEYEYVYHYILPEKFDCIDYKKSHCEKDDNMPGGLRITNGFAIKESVVNNIDIFRVDGLSNRKLVISEKLKKIFDENQIKGVKYTETTQYRDIL